MNVNGLTSNQVQLAKQLIGIIDQSISAGVPLFDISLAVNLAAMHCIEKLGVDSGHKPEQPLIAVAKNIPRGARVVRGE